jgi:transposase
MIQLTPHMQIFIAIESIDFRKGIDGLAAICRQKLEMDPFSGALFLFRNRARSTLKILVYDGQGFWLCTKRLSQGRFHWWPERTQATMRLHARDLQTLLGNGNPEKAEFAKDWKKICT